MRVGLYGGLQGKLDVVQQIARARRPRFVDHQLGAGRHGVHDLEVQFGFRLAALDRLRGRSAPRLVDVGADHLEGRQAEPAGEALQIGRLEPVGLHEHNGLAGPGEAGLVQGPEIIKPRHLRRSKTAHTLRPGWALAISPGTQPGIRPDRVIVQAEHGRYHRTRLQW